MHLDVWGHAGARVIVFPTTMGTWREWPDRRMPEVLSEHLENGWIQMYFLDQVHDESWYGKHLHPGARASAATGRSSGRKRSPEIPAPRARSVRPGRRH